MKLLKRWLAFFVVVVLVISVAFNSRGPLRASHIGEENTTTNNTGELDGQTAEDTQQAEGDTGENTEQGEPAPDASTAEQPEVQEETPAEQPAEPEAPHQDEMELSQVMTGENGETVCKVTANIQEGTFEANTADVTMEVTYAAADTTEQIKTLMSKAVAEGNVLGNYFLYNVIFKVNGEQVEPGKEIKITFEQNNFQIKDTKKATTFYYNEANSVAGNAEAEIVKITQKSDKIEELQNAGESIDNIDDYDLSEISLKEDNLADKIMMEGRRSTIYGCYVEDQKPQEEAADQNKENKEEEKTNKPESLKYEDDEVAITVTAEKEGIIPTGSTLQVVPIKKDEKDTKDQYKEVEEKLQEKAEKEEYDIAGFLAYDISFVDADGNKVEPNGEVKVVMDYKEAVLPEEVDEEKAKDADVTVLHLEEDKKGEVKDVVDMGQNEKIENVETTENKEVQKTEFKTESFSVFTITWTNKNGNTPYTIKFNYVDELGNSISGNSGTGDPIKGNKTIDLTSPDYLIEIAGYTNSRITVDKYDNTIKVSKIYRSNSNMYYNDSTYWSGSGGAIYNVYFVYSKNETPGGGETDGEATLDAPNHNKVIKYNEGEKDYTLTLDVTGEKGETVGADVLFVLDRSASMTNNGSKRLENLQTAVTTAANKLLTKDSNNRVAAVWFSYADTETTVWDTGWIDYSGKSGFINKIESVTANGGTNWQLAMRKANEKMGTRPINSNNKKYVIFISDGQPTESYQATTGYNKYSTEGDGTTYNTSYFNMAVKEVQEVGSQNNLKNSTFYSVYMDNSSFNTGGNQYTTVGERMTTFANQIRGYGGIQASGEDATQSIDNTLQKITQNILTPAYKNVTIEDTLTEYVDFTDNPNFTVTSKKDTKITELTENKDYTIEVKDKKVIVTLLNGKELDEGVTYSLSFNVKPTQNAYDYYITNGKYPHIGDKNTDAKGNETSSEKEGFYSNDKAVVKYQVNAGTLTEAEYAKPVVQIDTGSIDIPEEPNPIDGSITKTMGAVTEDGKYPITLDVKTRLEETSENAKVDVVLVIDTSASMTNNGSQRLTHTQTAAKAFVKNLVGEEGSVSQYNRVGIVTFSGSAQIKKTFTGDVSELLSAIDSISASGGTNTESGFKKAEELAKQSDRSNKYVIFLTDGVPTYSNSSSSGGSTTTVGEYQDAVTAANSLKKSVSGIYTIGLLNGMKENTKDIDVARRLLASNNAEHQHKGYTDCYYPSSTDRSKVISGTDSGTVSWNTNKAYTYSEGYFEILSNDDAEDKLSSIWTELATIIINKTAGSTGDGWIVTDQMADYTSFYKLDGADMNGHKLTLSGDGLSLTTVIDRKQITVAEYNKNNKTLTWYLNASLAEQSIKYLGGVDYSYKLTYYVSFEDSGKTEFRKTNNTTYVTKKEDNKKLYPPTMPFFVNVTGTKIDDTTKNSLTGAKFSVYRNADKTGLIAEDITSDENGHFAFQVGQSDLVKQNSNIPESYTMKVYLLETEAPDGYVGDNNLREITINVTNVRYSEEGVPSGTASISYTSNQDDLLEINKNEMKLIYSNKSRPDWGIVKKSTSGGDLYLSGAEFALYKVNEETGVTELTSSYTGISNEKGLILTWVETKTNNQVSGKFIPAGTYLMKETKAPTGYTLSNEEWKIELSATNIKITSIDKDVEMLSKEEMGRIEGLDKNGSYFIYRNTPLYDLPSTGGSGIFWYTVGGTLLMCLAGLLTLYKNKRKRGVGLSK